MSNFCQIIRETCKVGIKPEDNAKIIFLLAIIQALKSKKQHIREAGIAGFFMVVNNRIEAATFVKSNLAMLLKKIHDPSETVRAGIAKILGMSAKWLDERRKKVVAKALRILTKDPSVSVSGEAAHSLFKLKIPRASRSLLSMLKSRKSSERANAVCALGNWGKGTGDMRKKVEDELLLMLFSDKSIKVKEAIASMWPNRKMHVEALKKALVVDPAPHVRQAAFKTLRHACYKFREVIDKIELLRLALRDSSPEVYMLAVDELKWSEDKYLLAGELEALLRREVESERIKEISSLINR